MDVLLSDPDHQKANVISSTMAKYGSVAVVAQCIHRVTRYGIQADSTTLI